MGEPSSVGDLLEAGADRADEILDASTLTAKQVGQAMETVELLRKFSPSAANAYATWAVTHPARVFGEQSRPCVCDHGWLRRDDGVTPCARCRPVAARRADCPDRDDYTLGPRNHLNHQSGSRECPDCCRLAGRPRPQEVWQ